MSHLLSILGLPSVAALGWYALAFLLAMGIAAGVAGYAVHSYDTTIHQAALDRLDATASKALAAAQQKARDQEHQGQAKLAAMEERYAHLAEENRRAQDDGRRIAADLAAARSRLLTLAGKAGSGGDRVPGTDAGADGCADLQTALGRAAGALELYEAEGQQAVDDGQRGVDVATVAAQAANHEIDKGGR